MPPPLIPTWGYGEFTPPLPSSKNKGGSDSHPPPCERSTMFVVEIREVGGKTWERIYEEESMEMATMAKDRFARRQEFRGFKVKNFEWRIRQIKVGEKPLSSE